MDLFYCSNAKEASKVGVSFGKTVVCISSRASLEPNLRFIANDQLEKIWAQAVVLCFLGNTSCYKNGLRKTWGKPVVIEEISASVTRTLSIVMNILNTAHSASEENCFLLQAKTIIRKQI
jgi:hypothetical protein